MDLLLAAFLIVSFFGIIILITRQISTKTSTNSNHSYHEATSNDYGGDGNCDSGWGGFDGGGFDGGGGDGGC